MKISVIIPTYKPQEYLWKCLDSLNTQILCKNLFEVILILNGCKEPYDTQIKKYIAEHNDLNIVYIQTDEGGVSNARNEGLDVAEGEYITFIDDDDYVSPQYLQRLLEAALPDTVSLAKPIAFYDDSGIEWAEYPITQVYIQNYLKGRATPSSVRRYFSGPCMKLIPKEFIQERRFDKRFTIGEDTLFMFLISDKIKKVSFAVSDAVYYRRYRKGSLLMTQGNYKKRLSNQFKLLSVMAGYYFPHFWRYNLKFTLLQFASVLKGMFR